MTKLQDFDFVIKHMSRESNRRVDTLSRLDRAEKVSAKVGTVLLEKMFVQFLSGAEVEEEMDIQDKSRAISES
jgi:hypothetical protein